MVASLQSEKEFLDETAKWLGEGERGLAEALPQVYNELREVAGVYLRRERPNHTLQPTALVHEAYLRLRDQRNVDWSNRAQFLGVAARMMRRILVDHALARRAAKRGSDATRVSLDIALEVFQEQDLSALEVNRALQELEVLDPRQGQIVEMRFFGGMTVTEIAEALGVSTPTVKREWALAKLWLECEMRRP
jgi:RNA polymerase sigma-70 factor (ECF subfamily)